MMMMTMMMCFLKSSLTPSSSKNERIMPWWKWAIMPHFFFWRIYTIIYNTVVISGRIIGMIWSVLRQSFPLYQVWIHLMRENEKFNGMHNGLFGICVVTDVWHMRGERCVMKSNFRKNFLKKVMYQPGRLVSLSLLTQWGNRSFT